MRNVPLRWAATAWLASFSAAVLTGFLAGFSAGFLAATPLSARELDASEAETLAAAAIEYEQALRAASVGPVFDLLPPRFAALLAQRQGRSVQEMRIAALENADRTLGARAVDMVALDAAAVHGLAVTEDGVLYGLVPFRHVYTTDDGRFEARGDVIALRDRGVWWLLLLRSSGQAAILAEAYPGLAGLDFTPATTRRFE